ncbi:MAG: DUF1538 family protein [Lawsonibacter sp.]
MLLNIPLSHTAGVFLRDRLYAVRFAPDSFIPAAFDSGGVTTGPITVPFIMALGIGMAAIRSDKNSSSDSFGLVSLCSIGPILSVMILGIVYAGCGRGLYPGVHPGAYHHGGCRLVFPGVPAYIGEVAGGPASGPDRRVFQLLFRRFHRHLQGNQLLRGAGPALYLCGPGAVSGGGQRGLYARRCHHRRHHRRRR